MARGKKMTKGATVLYEMLLEKVESSDYKTGWNTTDDICKAVFSTITMKTMHETRRAILTVRKILKRQHQKLFYHTETEGYVLLATELQYREVIKRQLAISDGFLHSAQVNHEIGSSVLPALRNLPKLDDFKRLQTHIRQLT
jgi:hypothetical protein